MASHLLQSMLLYRGTGWPSRADATKRSIMTDSSTARTGPPGPISPPEEGVQNKNQETKRGCGVDRSRKPGRELAIAGSGHPSENGESSRSYTSVQSLPKELGVLLVVGGIGGLLLPGPVGSPFLIVGGVILWPSAFRRVDQCFEKRFPAPSSPGYDADLPLRTRSRRRYPWRRPARDGG